ncbi:hypothetical protein D5266_09450, partial [bacterium c-19]|nr:hypothetical protein [bacterium c-19]
MGMWKKLLIVLVALLGVLSGAYAYYNVNMNAANTTYNIGGNITGRVNMAPNGISGSNIGMQIGDHVVISESNPYTGNPLSFQLLWYDRDYTDYDNTFSINVVRTPISSWFTASDELVTPPFIINDIRDASKFNIHTGDHDYCFSDFTRTIFFEKERDFNNYLRSNAEQSIIAKRDLSDLRNAINYYSISAPTSSYSIINTNENKAILDVAKDHSAFFSSGWLYYTGCGSGGLNTNLNLLAFSQQYLTTLSIRRSTVVDPDVIHVFATNGPLDGITVSKSSTASGSFRPFIFLDMSNVVFALSQPNGSSIRAQVDDTFSINISAPYYTQGGSKMKLRLLDPTMTVAFNDMTSMQGNTLSKTTVGSTIKINASGNAGSQYTLSALIFDSNNHLIGYQPLDDTHSGNYSYEFDTTGLPLGKYKIGIVNEVYDETSMMPTKSSLITDVRPLEIVEPHKITYTKTPQSGASSGKDYEFGKNVNAGQAVGKITVNPQGVMPLTYTVETNGDNTYQNFEIDGLDSNGTSSSTPLNVKVKSGAPDLVNGGLKAGTYKFCVSAKDANGDPATATSDSKVCTSFTVEKTDLSIAFNDPSQTKKSISDAATSWNETATATPNTGTKITYSVSGGDISLISINPDTGAITYTGSNAFGKVKIKATVDDDPTTGDDNYNSAFVEKEIVIYREVDGSVTPHSNSSDTTTPTFTASDSNIRTGG